MEILSLIEGIIEDQEKKLLILGRQIVPNLTHEDMLQPVDYPELETHPVFRYEEGILEGMQTVRFALLALIGESSYGR